jgi:putative DNA primase/helicase
MSPTDLSPQLDSEDREPSHANARESGAKEGTLHTRPRSRRPGPLVNAIQPTRSRSKTTAEEAPPAQEAAALPTSDTPAPEPRSRAPSAAAPKELASADTDPWTVPQSVRDRFVQDGQRFYFPDGAPAFRDFGHRLTTTSENSQVVHSLVEIAHARGWSEVTVSGTERFRQESWRQCRLAGLAVRGYQANDPEKDAMIRAMARNLAQPASSREDTISAETRASQSPASSRAPAPAAPAPNTSTENVPRERIVGRLIEHARDAYRHDPKEEISYFVRLETPDGKREVWGKDLERAMTKSLTQPQIGDEVVLQQTGRDVVTVKRTEREASGELKPQEVDTYRNRWVIEKSEFFAERAQAAHLVRDASIDPRTAVRERPELAGTYLNLKAGELAAQRLRDPEDRRRFVALLRSALADDIERGEPLQPVRLRERSPRVATRAGREEDRDLAR